MMHDFASISLSDLLTPWETIQKRLELAAQADFIIVLYNPKSKKRDWQEGEPGTPLPPDRAVLDLFVKSLPFELTPPQEKVEVVISPSSLGGFWMTLPEFKKRVRVIEKSA